MAAAMDSYMIQYGGKGQGLIELAVQVYKCRRSKFLTVYALLHVLHDAPVVVGEAVVLVLGERAVHDLEQLLLARVVGLADLGLDLVEPVLDGVELGRVGRQVEHLHPALLPQTHRLLPVVDGAVVQHQPLLPPLPLPLLPQPQEQLLDEVQVLVLAVGALDDAPVRQPVLRDDGDQREALALGDGAVDGDLLVGSRPGLVAGHVEVEAALVEEVDARPPLPERLVLRAVVVALLEGLGGVALLGHALHPLLLELAHLQQPRHRRPRDLHLLAVLHVLQVLDLVELHRELVLREEGVLLDEPGHVLQPLEGDLALGDLLLEVVPADALVEGGVLHPLRVQLADRRVVHVEDLPDLAHRHLRAPLLAVALLRVVLVELGGQQLERLPGQLLALARLAAPPPLRLQLQVAHLPPLLLRLRLLLLQLLLDAPRLHLHVLPLLPDRLPPRLRAQQLVLPSAAGVLRGRLLVVRRLVAALAGLAARLVSVGLQEQLVVVIDLPIIGLLVQAEGADVSLLGVLRLPARLNHVCAAAAAGTRGGRPFLQSSVTVQYASNHAFLPDLALEAIQEVLAHSYLLLLQDAALQELDVHVPPAVPRLHQRRLEELPVLLRVGQPQALHREFPGSFSEAHPQQEGVVAVEVGGQQLLPSRGGQVLQHLHVQLQHLLVEVADVLMHLVLGQGSQYLQGQPHLLLLLRHLQRNAHQRVRLQPVPHQPRVAAVPHEAQLCPQPLLGAAGAVDEAVRQLGPALQQFLGNAVSEEGELGHVPEVKQAVEQLQRLLPGKLASLGCEVLLELREEGEGEGAHLDVEGVDVADDVAEADAVEEVGIGVVHIQALLGEELPDAEVAGQELAHELHGEEARAVEGVQEHGEHGLVAGNAERVLDLHVHELHDDLHLRVQHLQQPHRPAPLPRLPLLLPAPPVVLPDAPLQLLLHPAPPPPHHDLLQSLVDRLEGVQPQLVDLAAQVLGVGGGEAQVDPPLEGEGRQPAHEGLELLGDQVLRLSRGGDHDLLAGEHFADQGAHALELLGQVVGLEQLLVEALAADALGVGGDGVAGLGVSDEDAAAARQLLDLLLAAEEGEHADELREGLLDDVEGHARGVLGVEDEDEPGVLSHPHEVVHGHEVGGLLWLEEGEGGVDEGSAVLELVEVGHAVGGVALLASDLPEGVLVLVAVGHQDH